MIAPVPRSRTITPVLPREIAVHDGLAYSLWLPPDRRLPPRHGVVILHGAGSCKETHHDFARTVVATGMAAVAFDMRGHGDSEGVLDDRALDDVASIVRLLRSKTESPELPVALRGSSMGGYLAILAAPAAGAGAVVAVCPASGEGLRRGLLAGRFEFEADVSSLAAFLEAHDLSVTVESLEVPLLLLHAEGDEQVPVEHSRELAARAPADLCRLVTVAGGHHRSVQQDPELRALSLRWIKRALTQ
jgi:alpha-beta hydrolase superfamily lysophospholipase